MEETASASMHTYIYGKMSVKMRVKALPLKVHLADLQKLRCFLVKSGQVHKIFQDKEES